MNKVTYLAAISAFLLVSCSNDSATGPSGAVAKPAVSARPVPKELKPEPMPYEEPVVGGQVMRAGKDLMSNLALSSDHKILLAAVRAADMDKALAGPGPLTLFAPTDAAFSKLPVGTMERLMKPENKDELTQMLAYHIVQGKFDADALASRVMAGNGEASLDTVEGTRLRLTVGEGQALIVDGKGHVAHITVPNVVESNGVMQVVDSVLMP